MKKYGKLILTVLLIAMIALVAVACDNTPKALNAPVIRLEGNSVLWQSVANADGYGVVIDGGKEIKVNKTSFVITDKTEARIKVRALGDGENYLDSAYSAELIYKAASGIAAPALGEPEETDGGIKVSWSSVEGANEYFVQMLKGGKEVISERVTATDWTVPMDKFEKVGNYVFRVYAIGDKGNSLYSNEVIYTVEGRLTAPTNIKLEDNKLTFDKVEDADRYILTLTDINDPENVVVIEKFKESGTIGDQIITMDITTSDVEKAGVYKLTLQAAMKNNALLEPSDVVEVKNAEGEDEVVKRYAAPELSIDGDGILSWQGLEEGLEYELKYYSGDKNASDTTTGVKAEEKSLNCSYDLKDSRLGDSASSLYGYAARITVKVKENREKNVLDGIESEQEIRYQFSKQPNKAESDGYYLITNAAELAYMSVEPGANYKLSQNLNFDGAEIFSLTDQFSGIFDGAGFTISNFTLIHRNSADIDKDLSLFGVIGENGILKNFTLVRVAMQYNETGDKAATNLVQYTGDCAILAIENKGTIDTVAVTGTVITTGKAAGMVIKNSNKISNAFAAVKINGGELAAGIAAENIADIVNARVFGGSDTEIKANVIIGMSTETAQGEKTVAGGLVAVNSGNISYSSVSLMPVSARTEGASRTTIAGALIGYDNGGVVSKCYVDKKSGENSFLIKADDNGTNKSGYAGGFIGYAERTAVDTSYAIYVKANGNKAAGGFIGYADGVKVTNSYVANMEVSGSSESVMGAVIGEATGSNIAMARDYYSNQRDSFGASQETSDANIKNVDKREDMDNAENLGINGMNVNRSVQNEYLVISDQLYFGKSARFSVGEISKGDREYTKAYMGYDAEDGLEPTVKGSLDMGKSGTDRYEVEYNGVNKVLMSFYTVKKN